MALPDDLDRMMLRGAVAGVALVKATYAGNPYKLAAALFNIGFRGVALQMQIREAARYAS